MTPELLATAAGPVELAETGRGPAVLVLHGTPGDWSQAVALAEDLAGGHRVLLVSRPGYGRTPLRTGRSPREQATAYAALLDALGIDEAAVVGISGGGPSARAFAVDHADRCTHLVLVSAVAAHLVQVPARMRVLAAVPGLWEAGARVAARRKRQALLDRTLALSRAQAELGPAEQAALATDPQVADDLMAFGHHNARVLTAVPGLRNDFRWFHALRDRQPWPDTSAVQVLVLHGDVDPVVPLDHGHDHEQHSRGARLEVFEGAGHALALTLRRTVSARIAAFLDQT